jgi:hypothetical protein
LSGVDVIASPTKRMSSHSPSFAHSLLSSPNSTTSAYAGPVVSAIMQTSAVIFFITSNLIFKCEWVINLLNTKHNYCIPLQCPHQNAYIWGNKTKVPYDPIS